MALLSIFFYTNQIHGGIISRLFFIHFVAPCACSSSSGLKYISNLSVWRFEHVGLTYICCISLQNASRTALCYATNTIKWKTFLIFDINHQQNTRRSDQIETIKTIMQTTRPRITWKVLPMAQVAIFKEIFDHKWKDLDCELVLF